MNRAKVMPLMFFLINQFVGCFCGWYSRYCCTRISTLHNKSAK